MPVFSHLDGPLYRDHLGRDVIADYEGVGFLSATSTDFDWVEPSGLSHGIFKEFCLIGSVETPKSYCISIGECTGKVGETVAISEKEFKGSGVVSSVESKKDSVIWVDGSRTKYGIIPKGTNLELRIAFNSNFKVDSEAVISVSDYRPSAWVQTDKVEVCRTESRMEHNLLVQNESEIYQLNSEFDAIQHSGFHRSHLNRMSFDANIDPENNGVMIRKTYDRFHGRQRARVLIDGQNAGWWYLPRENREKRWADADFRIAKNFTEGQTKIRIEIDPSAGSPLWNVSSYQVFSIPKSQ